MRGKRGNRRWCGPRHVRLWCGILGWMRMIGRWRTLHRRGWIRMMGYMRHWPRMVRRWVSMLWRGCIHRGPWRWVRMWRCRCVSIRWVRWWCSRHGSILVPICRTRRCSLRWRMVDIRWRSYLVVNRRHRLLISRMDWTSLTISHRRRRLVVPTRSWRGLCLYSSRRNGHWYYWSF